MIELSLTSSTEEKRTVLRISRLDQEFLFTPEPGLVDNLYYKIVIKDIFLARSPFLFVSKLVRNNHRMERAVAGQKNRYC